MAMEKKALLGAVLKGVGGAVVRNPGKALGGAALTYAGGSEAINKTKQFKEGFNPQSPQQQLAGAVPRPPGA
jgi:hypothetical protein